MDIVPIVYNKKKYNIEEFRYDYREELDFIFNNYVRPLIIDNNIPIINIRNLYYDMIKFFYLTSI